MANPVLNDKAFKQATQAEGGTWAPPDSNLAAEAAAGTRVAPMTDGPISPYTSVREGAMTMGGTVAATAVLFALLLAAGAYGWTLVESVPEGQNANFPGWLFLPMIGAFGLVMLAMFKPRLAKFAAPVYAICQGMVLGAISHLYENFYSGIVIQAIGATAGVFFVVLVMYALRIVKVTNRFRNVVIAATFGIMIFYGFSLLLTLFGFEPPFLYSSSGWGILFSVFVAGIAALNLFIDFDTIERGVKMGAPGYMEWVGSLGLLVTVVWLYLEMLRLLAKIRN